MAEDKKFPTPSMVKAQERWDRMTEAEKEAKLNELREELRRHYEGRPTGEVRRLLLGQDE